MTSIPVRIPFPIAAVAVLIATLLLVPLRMPLIDTQAWRDITAWAAERILS